MINKIKQNPRNLIIILFMLAIVTGCTFAFLQAQLFNSKITDVDVEIATVDSLTFSTSGSFIGKATEENLGKDKGNIKGEVIAQAHLISNSKITYNYYIYLDIVTNNFVYTSPDQKPELILKITDPTGQEITDQNVQEFTDDLDLIYHTKRENDENDVSGFDVTQAQGIFTIAMDYPIITNDDSNEENHDWTFTLYFINLDNNQKGNSNNKFDAKVLIKNGPYEPVEIDVTDETTANSITLDVNTINHDGEVEKYMYSNNDGKTWKEFVDNNLKHSYIFSGLLPDTTYNVRVQVIDNNGIGSNVFKKSITTDFIRPVANNIILTAVSANSITAQLNATDGSSPISTYNFKLNSGDVESSDSNIHTFAVDDNKNYTITAYVTDVKDHTSSEVSVSYENPEIESINLEDVSEDSIKITLKGLKKSAEIKNYYLSIDDGSSWQEIPNTAEEVTYTYESINKENLKKIRAYAVDINNRKSEVKIMGVGEIIINFNANGNALSEQQANCYLIDGADSCKITTPKITPANNTPNVIGFSTSASDRTKLYGSEEEITVKTSENGKTYYAQSKSDEIVRKITFSPNGNTSFTYNGDTSTSEKSYNFCTIDPSYNGATQGTSCTATITMPTIAAHTNTSEVIGWNASASTHTATYKVNASATIRATADLKFYAQTTKSKVTYKVNFVANGNTIAATSKTCDLAATFNGTKQATECTIITPIITAPANTKTIIGYNQDKSAHTAQVKHNASLAVTSSINGKTYYAITQAAAKTFTVTFRAGANTSRVGASSGSCNIAATYNGTKQATECTVTTPSITPVNSNYISVGWSTTNGATSGTAAGSKITLTASGKTYYGNCIITISMYSSVTNSTGGICGNSKYYSRLYTYTITVASGVSIGSGKMCYASSATKVSSYCSNWPNNGKFSFGYVCFTTNTTGPFTTNWQMQRSQGYTYAQACTTAGKCVESFSG